jgi:hydroxymethylglutaryl-CoA synthase|tara:strand:- start:10941 stop:12383 length:1443 start_codon:yes stop_codon:yes gene_type:complete
MKKVGIDALSYYVPSLYVDIKDLASSRDIAPEKLEAGLGLRKMTTPDYDEDSASIAANSLYRLIKDNNIDPRKVGRVYLGTESGVDASKPTSSYVVEIIENILSEEFGERCFKNCDIVDLTFACAGAVDALENCCDWVKNGYNRQAIVIASDIAKYELYSTGEYTQGAGSVSMLICENPSIISFNGTWGVSTKGIGDFFKPRRVFKKSNILIEAAKLLGQDVSENEAEIILESANSKFWSDTNDLIEIYKEEPIFEGQFSNESYKERVHEAIENFNEQNQRDFLTDWENIIFHLPYAFHGRRMIINKWLDWMSENNLSHKIYSEIGEPISEDDKEWIRKVSKSSIYKSFIEEKISPGERASSEIGNMYTASIFMSLISSLIEANINNKDFENKKIGFISYGSGSKAKIFEGTIQKNWIDKVKNLNLFENLNNRKKISVETYEKLHKSKVSSNINNNDGIIKLSKISNEEFTEGLRNYIKY